MKKVTSLNVISVTFKHYALTKMYIAYKQEEINHECFFFKATVPTQDAEIASDEAVSIEKCLNFICGCLKVAKVNKHIGWPT